jgi:NAD(P)-dependent dehydrogenase (short-subunit alcohol dehydrogenase family)
LRGRTALVTGANRGLGRLISLRLAGAGAHVILGVRSPQRGLPVAESIAAGARQAGGSSEVLQLDMSSFESIARAGATLRARPQSLHVLINNAGVFFDDEDRDLQSLTPEILSLIMTVNAMGPLMLIKEMLPLLRRAGGSHVVNISSDLADFKEMNGGNNAYRMSKVAVSALTLNLAGELAGDGIRVSAFDPGWMKTDMGGPDATEDPEESADGLLATVLLPATEAAGRIWWKRALPSPILKYP